MPRKYYHRIRREPFWVRVWLRLLLTTMWCSRGYGYAFPPGMQDHRALGYQLPLRLDVPERIFPSHQDTGSRLPRHRVLCRFAKVRSFQ